MKAYLKNLVVRYFVQREVADLVRRVNELERELHRRIVQIDTAKQLLSNQPEDGRIQG